MTISDASFREAFKPLHIPAHYNAADSDQDKTVYALAQLGEGTVEDIAHKLAEIDPAINAGQFASVATHILYDLFKKGLIKGLDNNGQMHYDLSKITEANDGAVNPSLLAPGLD